MHTPGSWQANMVALDGSETEVVNSHNEQIALVVSESAVSDAVLISAAPDMLSALKFVMATFYGKLTEEMREGSGEHPAFAIIRNAIAKAEGSLD